MNFSCSKGTQFHYDFLQPFGQNQNAKSYGASVPSILRISPYLPPLQKTALNKEDPEEHQWKHRGDRINELLIRHCGEAQGSSLLCWQSSYTSSYLPSTTLESSNTARGTWDVQDTHGWGGGWHSTKNYTSTMWSCFGCRKNVLGSLEKGCGNLLGGIP